ncbi:MAG: YdcF family protein [Spirosomataceae bacterium]
MFFFLSKILYYFLMPISWVLYVLIYALLTKKTRLRRRLIGVAIIILMFFGNGYIQNTIFRWWEVKPIALSAGDVYDVAIVLTGDIASLDEWQPERPSFGHGADRLWQALKLYKKGQVHKILISGGSVELPGILQGGKESTVVKKFLVETFQLNPDDIWLEDKSRNTHENAVNSAQMLRDSYPKGGTYLLCTSAFHMRRAQGCFTKIGLKTTMYATDIRSAKPEITLDNLYPREQPLFMWQVLLREWVGYITYGVLGYL